MRFFRSLKIEFALAEEISDCADFKILHYRNHTLPS